MIFKWRPCDSGDSHGDISDKTLSGKLANSWWKTPLPCVKVMPGDLRAKDTDYLDSVSVLMTPRQQLSLSRPVFPGNCKKILLIKQKQKSKYHTDYKYTGKRLKQPPLASQYLKKWMPDSSNVKQGGIQLYIQTAIPTFGWVE